MNCIRTALLVTPILLVACRPSNGDDLRRSIVRVTSNASSGTGFFVDGPDGKVYVATAFHVIQSGSRLSVERPVDVSETENYVRAYPNVDVVAYDVEADLALLALPNVPRTETPPLKIGEPKKDSAITSFGFPASAFVRQLGLTRKEGQLSNFVELPVIDRRRSKVVRVNAIKAIIVSTALEPGFSGGPTLDAQGRVVGVNVLKDRAHRDQNAAVHVDLLRDLLARASQPGAPTEAQIEGFLSDVQSNYLSLPLSKRPDASELSIMSLHDVPHLSRFVEAIQRAELSSKESGSAAAFTGIALSRMPGRLFETYHSADVRASIAACHQKNHQLSEYLDGIGLTAPQRNCTDLALRPIAWDLVAATLHWDGTPRKLTVTRIESIDPRAGTFKATIRAEGRTSVIAVHVRPESGRLGLRLFTEQGAVYAMEAAADVPARSFAGTWKRHEPRAPLGESDVQRWETLSVSANVDGRVGMKHEFRRRVYAPRGRVFSCGKRRALSQDIVQQFVGHVRNGVVVAKPERKAVSTGRACECKLACYSADLVVSLKIIDGRLLMYRTDGTEFPEVAEFERAEP